MNRPARKLKNVEEKLARKSSLETKRVGKKAKRWKKAVTTYTPVVQGQPA